MGRARQDRHVANDKTFGVLYEGSEEGVRSIAGTVRPDIVVGGRR